MEKKKSKLNIWEKWMIRIFCVYVFSISAFIIFYRNLPLWATIFYIITLGQSTLILWSIKVIEKKELDKNAKPKNRNKR